jgi:orotidine-5'-phosphate decarboxylase
MAAYAEAYLGKDAVAPGDALTVSPYLGFESLRPALDLAAQTHRGVFVLALTSNPEGRTVQHARLRETSVAESMVTSAAAENAAAAARGELGSVGLVVGATVGTAVQELELDLAAVNGPLLSPGVGAQGGTSDDLRRVFGDALPNVLPASSREVLSAGPDVAALRDRAVQTSASLAALLR